MVYRLSAVDLPELAYSEAQLQTLACYPGGSQRVVLVRMVRSIQAAMVGASPPPVSGPSNPGRSVLNTDGDVNWVDEDGTSFLVSSRSEASKNSLASLVFRRLADDQQKRILLSEAKLTKESVSKFFRNLLAAGAKLDSHLNVSDHQQKISLLQPFKSASIFSKADKLHVLAGISPWSDNSLSLRDFGSFPRNRPLDLLQNAQLGLEFLFGSTHVGGMLSAFIHIASLGTTAVSIPDEFFIHQVDNALFELWNFYLSVPSLSHGPMSDGLWVPFWNEIVQKTSFDDTTILRWTLKHQSNTSKPFKRSWQSYSSNTNPPSSPPSKRLSNPETYRLGTKILSGLPSSPFQVVNKINGVCSNSCSRIEYPS
jgi:hypothetical protein